VILVGAAVGVAILATACPDSAKAPTPAPRVESAATRPAPRPDSFCDAQPDVPLAMPPLVGGARPRAPGWTWINVWATWCAPCVEEIPRLAEWQRRLAKDGAPVHLEWVSVDEAAEAVASFRAARPEIADSSQLVDPAAAGAWFAALGLGQDVAIPVHLWVDGDGQVRCARAGALRDDHYASVLALIGPQRRGPGVAP
jgi:thiol-disulfide isomerase/thioredoxin